MIILNFINKMSKYDLDVMQGVYKCTGDIKHLRMRVRLEIIKSSVIPLSNVEEQETGLNPQSNEMEQCTFIWQQKVFSPEEIKYYSNKQNCSSPYEEEYHKQVSQIILNKQFPLNRIFSYVTTDKISKDLCKDILLDNVGTEYLRKLNLSKLPDNAFEDVQCCNTIPRRNIVVDNPSNDLKKRNRTLMSSYNSMHILADLSERDSSNEETVHDFNHLLVSLKWNPKNNTLLIFPDFISLDSPGYKIEDDNIRDTRLEYRFWIVNMSECEEQNEECTPYQAPLNRGLDIQVMNEFNMPNTNKSEIYIFGEIQKAIGFEYNHLIVQYFIDVPNGWSSEGLLSGFTCKAQYGKLENTAVFSHLFDLKLTTTLDASKNNNSGKENRDSSYHTQHPQLFLQIISLDNWNCCRIEGYTWTIIPVSPGSHSLKLGAWRPTPVTAADNLCRFFIGWQPELNDLLYSGIPSENNVLLSRYGFTTQSSGDVYIKLNIIKQCSGVGSDKSKLSFPGSLPTTLTMMNNINDVLEAFKRARQRMLIAREPILNYPDESREISKKQR